MTGRALRYWVRDSRYQVSVVALPVVVGLLLALPALTDAPPAFALMTGPLLGLMLGLTMLNELAFDGSAFWTGLAAAVRGRDDRLARALGAAAVGGAGHRRGRGRGGLARRSARPGAGRRRAGARRRCSWQRRWPRSSSVALPFPVPPAGSNPFSGNAGAGTAALVQQGLSLLVLLPLLAPAARSRRLGVDRAGRRLGPAGGRDPLRRRAARGRGGRGRPGHGPARTGAAGPPDPLTASGRTAVAPTGRRRPGAPPMDGARAHGAGSARRAPPSGASCDGAPAPPPPTTSTTTAAPGGRSGPGPPSRRIVRHVPAGGGDDRSWQL